MEKSEKKIQETGSNCYLNILLSTNLIDLIKVLNVFFFSSFFILAGFQTVKLHHTKQQSVFVSKLHDAMDKNEYDRKSIKINLMSGKNVKFISGRKQIEKYFY